MLPWPSIPAVPHPKVATPPSWRMRAVCRWPHAMSTTPGSRLGRCVEPGRETASESSPGGGAGGTAVGTVKTRRASPEAPSSPAAVCAYSAWPQANTSPPAVSATLWFAPHETLTHASPGNARAMPLSPLSESRAAEGSPTAGARVSWCASSLALATPAAAWCSWCGWLEWPWSSFERSWACATTTSSGQGRSRKSPPPRAPKTPRPQEKTRPSAQTATECCCPHAAWTTLAPTSAKRVTWRGVCTE
mmetsp:Transcript_3286/g.9487  ORF Transcript_3286/g.9487 Transcript_3286/m.9487 type:complete len:247 (+) Transcript_3286:1812-2552(+)